jgi:hypothetical protein
MDMNAARISAPWAGGLGGESKARADAAMSSSDRASLGS